MSDRTVTAESYIVLVPSIYGSGSSRYVRTVRADRIRTAKPSLRRGEIALRLKLTFREKDVLDNIPTLAVDVTSFLAGPTEPVALEVTA